MYYWTRNKRIAAALAICGVLAVAFAVVLAVVLANTVASTPQPPKPVIRGHHNSEYLGTNGKYDTYLDTHTVDGRTVTCIVIQAGGPTMAASCDWNTR